MSAVTIDREAISDRLNLLGTVSGLMGSNPEEFIDTDHYAMAALLYDLAKKVFPDVDKAKA